MFVTALLLGLVGVFCILDSRILGRMNFERPLITCTIVGALLGDLQTGLTLGASIELMSLGIVNIGAAAPPDMNMAAIICAAFAILTDASAETALALAIPIAVLGQMLGVVMRTILSNLTHVADHAIAEGKFRKAWSMHIVWGTVLYSLMYFIPIFLSVYFGQNCGEDGHSGDIQTQVAHKEEAQQEVNGQIAVEHGGQQQGNTVSGKELTAEVQAIGQPCGDESHDLLHQIRAEVDGQEDGDEVH